MFQQKYIPKFKNTETKNSVNYQTRKKKLVIDFHYQKKNNPTQKIKFPKDLYKHANEKGLKHLLLTWYLAKSLSVNGSFKNQNDLATQINNIKIDGIDISSLSTIKKHLYKLKAYDLIFKDKNNKNRLSLCKYDKLYTFFEINLDTPTILKIKIEDLFTGKLFSEVIRRNLKKQEEKVKEHYFNKCSKSSKMDFDNKGRKKQFKKRTNKFLNQNLESIINFQYKNQYAKRLGYNYNQDFDKKTNDLFFDSSITQNKIANIFGYKTASKGSNMIKELVKSSLIFCQKRYLCIKNISNQEFSFLKRNGTLPSNSFYKNDSVFIRLMNKISFDKIDLNHRIFYLYENNDLKFNLNLNI